MEKQEERINADIKKLRNKYLHFNANYDGVVINPNLNGDKRERHIRGAVG